MLTSVLTCALLVVPLLGAWRVAAVALGDARLGLGAGALAWAAYAVAVAELLPVDRTWYLVAWSAAALAGGVVLGRAHARMSVRAHARAFARWWSLQDRWLRAGWIALAATGALTLLTALVAAPNNWDSMVYHLARVAEWVRLGDVRDFPTHVEPQLYQPPGAELLALQSYVLAGASDALTALVQWGAWLGCVVLAHRGAEALGARPRTQLAAALLVGTAPLAILEASSTQNDLVLAFWLLLGLVATAAAWAPDHDLLPHPRRRAAALLLLASAAIGMAVLTKGTGLLFGAPLGAWVAATAIRRVGIARAVPLAIAGLALVTLPNIAHWHRNHELYGQYVAAEHAGIENPYRVQDPGLSSLVSNLVRNATNHLDLPSDTANEHLEQWTTDALDALGIDASDPRTTFLGQPFRIGPFGPHEDHAGSLLLLVLGLWAIGSTVVARIRRRTGSGAQLAWLAVLAAQVLLFAWLVTWQNWHVRMHLPVTVAVAVLVAVRLGDRASGRARALAIVCALSVAMAPVYVLFNVTRPLAGHGSILTHSRASVRYEPRPQLRAPYGEVVRRVTDSDVRRVGLVTGIDDWQYPLLAAFAEHDVDVVQPLVTGPSTELDTVDPIDLDAVVCVNCTPAQEQALAAAGLRSVPLDAGGARHGRGDDVTTVALWQR